MSASHDVVVSWAQQSPINLEPAIYTEDLLPLEFKYGVVYGHLEGHDFIIDSTPAPELIIGTKTYPLKKLHFHKRSEHFINKVDFEYELHFVHADADFPSKSPSLFWAVGVFIDVVHEEEPTKEVEDVEHAFLEAAFTLKPLAEVPADVVPDKSAANQYYWVDLSQLIPGQEDWNHYWRYEGSLTTPFFERDGQYQTYPPFAELVSWIVLEKNVEIPTLADLKVVAESPHQRGLQPRNRRFVLRNFRLGGKLG